MYAREPASFWRENVVASSVYYEFWRECRSGGKKLSNVRSFIILRSGEDVTSFTKGNSANFSSENGKMTLARVRGSLYFENKRKNLKSNLALVVVLVLESKGL